MRAGNVDLDLDLDLRSEFARVDWNCRKCVCVDAHRVPLECARSLGRAGARGTGRTGMCGL